MNAEQWEIDARNLEFYAISFREHKWETAQLSWTVFYDTLNKIAARIRADHGTFVPFSPSPVLASDIVHGFNCPKVLHMRTGYLHDENDDRPYDVDGMKYCGRCHVAL